MHVLKIVTCFAIHLLVIASVAFGDDPNDPSSELVVLNDSVATHVKPDGASSERDATRSLQFGRDIQPILNRHCVACHGGVKQAAGLSFVYRDQVLPPDGWVVTPGDADNSELIARLRHADADSHMPPAEHGPPVSDSELETLRRWIDQGATWETGHWAYDPPRRHDVPVIDASSPQTGPSSSRSNWRHDKLDGFVQTAFVKRGLDASPDAPLHRWLRRASLDLTGLPPNATLRDQTDKLAQRFPIGVVKSKIVDRLLASPAYGERWASVWLDQIRYADSKGLGLDGRRNVWHYRDWVIDALNRDMPFDEFTIKQIAGDRLAVDDSDAGYAASLENRLATVAHRLTQSNQEGGTDDEEFRIEAVLDRVSTTWQTWQGVTFGCVQCHSHPYDPFRHDEFYRFAAFFNNTVDCDLDEDWPTLDVPNEVDRFAEAGRLDAEIDSLEHSIWNAEVGPLLTDSMWHPVETLTAKTAKATRLVTRQVPFDDRRNIGEFHTDGTVTQNTDINIEGGLPADVKSVTAIRVTAAPLSDDAQKNPEWGFVLSHVTAELVDGDKTVPLELVRVIGDEPDPLHDPDQTLNSKSNQGFGAYTQLHHPRHAALVLKQPIAVPPGASIRVTLKHRIQILGSFPLVTRRGRIAVSDDLHWSKIAGDQIAGDSRKRLSDLRTRRKRIPSTAVPVMADRPDRLARPTHVFERGLFLTKADRVEPGVPDVFQTEADRKVEPVDDRLKMARWLVDPTNPLTARVTVNRIWSRIFGRGLVVTEEDFGSSGATPSHPELLDDLAIRFRDDYHWSQKRLIRDIVLSRTYGQSAIASTKSTQTDPSNRWLSRGPRVRLTSEMVRDQALALSGLLSRKMFGPPVHPPIPDGVWRPFSAGDKWNTPPVGSEDRYRRSIYTYTKRSIPYPMFAAFDSPSREFCTPRRLSSNTPIQALTMLNDATFVEAASELAEQIEFDASRTDWPTAIANALDRVTGRKPDTADVETLVELQRVASTRAVATVLLNVDEIMTR